MIEESNCNLININSFFQQIMAAITHIWLKAIIPNKMKLEWQALHT